MINEENIMKKENKDSKSIKERFYKLSKEELKLIKILANIKSEDLSCLYGFGPSVDTGGPGSA